MKELITTYYLVDQPDNLLYHDENGIYPHVLNETIKFRFAKMDPQCFKIIEIVSIITEKRIERKVFLQEILE